MRLQTFIHGLLIPLLILSCASGDKPMGNNAMNDSDYIFQGRIIGEGTVTASERIPGKTTKTVQVENVILSAEGHEDFAGKTVHVVLEEDNAIKEGTSYLFYTKTWLFGNTLTVIANDAQPADNLARASKEVREFKLEQQEQTLKKRLDAAEVIIAGKVINVEDLKVEQRDMLSEHYPFWKIATVEVQETIKGELSTQQVRVYFASSIDVHWFKAPKLNREIEGVFVLNRKEQFQKTQNNFTITAPDEFYPISELNRIKQTLSKN